MKTKLIYGAVALCLVVAALLLQAAEANTAVVRYVQHREQPDEAALGPCARGAHESGLCTHLPIIRIDTAGQKIPGKGIVGPDGKILEYETGNDGAQQILVTLETVESAGTYHHGDDPADQTSRALFRIRGNSSRAFDKSSYRIQLVKDDDPESDRKLSLLGMSPDSEWALHGPFLDHTLMRNYMWMNVSAEVMGYAPNVRFCELMIDGEYRGVYVLMETIRQGEHRVNISEYRSGAPVCSYIVRIGANLAPDRLLDTFCLYTYRLEENKQVELLYPGRSRQSDQVRDYVATDLQQVERRLYSAEMTQNPGAWRADLDADAFVNYYILQEFLGINDMFSESTYFYRDVRGKLAVGPVWDYNNALNNFFTPLPHDSFLLAQRGWFGQLMMDEGFVRQVIDRYRALRRGALSEERLCETMDEIVRWLGSAVDRNFEVWGDSFQAETLPLWQRRSFELEPGESAASIPADEFAARLRTVNPEDYAEAVEWTKQYMIERGRWLDENIEALLQYSRESKNASLVID